MDFIFFILLFAIGTGTVFTTSGHAVKQKVDYDLNFVHTICRHGDRNIYDGCSVPYPNDKWASERYWPGGYTQLTKIGIQQHYALGQYLRERYAKLLGNGDYSADKVFVHSTDTDRTLMSAEACLASLFAPDPEADQIWNPKLNWQPVPVHTEPRNQDYLLAPEKPCDRNEYEMIKYTNSSAYKSLFTENSALIEHLEKKAGAPLNTLTKLDFLYDTLFIENLKGMSIPPWAEEIMKPGSDFIQLALQYYPLFTKTTEMKKLSSGYLLKEILDRSKNKTMAALDPDRSLWLYFAHDTTIVNMLNSLGLYELHVPPYASCLFFELYKSSDSTDSYLQLFYRNSTQTTDFPALKIPNCDFNCTLEKWYELYDHILPTKSYDEECQTKEPVDVKDNPEHFFV